MNNLRWANFATLLQPGPQDLAEVGHLAEVADAALVDPLQQLRGAKGLFALLDAEGRHGLPVEP